jgi:hypothetical protein
MCEDLEQNFDDKSWLLHHDNTPFGTSFLTKEFLAKNKMTLNSPTRSTLLFPRSKIKLEGHHFETTEVIEAES